jgi:hypothetical protein
MEIIHLLGNDHLTRLCIDGVLMLNDRSQRCINGSDNAIDI